MDRQLTGRDTRGEISPSIDRAEEPLSLIISRRCNSVSPPPLFYLLRGLNSLMFFWAYCLCVHWLKRVQPFPSTN